MTNLPLSCHPNIEMASGIFTKTWPYAAIIIAHLIWGVNFVVAKLTLQEFPPMSLSFLRFALAILLLAPFILTEKKRDKIKRKHLPWLFATGSLMVTLNIAFFYTGLTRTTVTSASVLTMVVPIFSLLLGWAFLKEKIYTVNLVGIAIGLIGAVSVIGLPALIFGEQIPTEMWIGNLLILFASLSWVIGSTISRQMLKEYSSLTMTFFIFLVGVLTFFIPAINEYLQDPSWPSNVTVLGIFGLAFITVASSISAFFLFEWGLGKLGVIQANLFHYIEPPIAATLAVLILGESLQFSFIIGGLLIALGVYWSTLLKTHHHHHQAHRT